MKKERFMESAAGQTNEFVDRGDFRMDMYINGSNIYAPELIARILKNRILQMKASWKETVIICIGTDRVTGDCLGPLVGDRLFGLCSGLPGIAVYGTLREPVHAMNLSAFREFLCHRHPDSLIIAVDASLGSKKHLGYITIGDGFLYPGAGIRKNLPGIGDLHITGIVNTGGFLEHLILQTTRLSKVKLLADTISMGIWKLLTAESCPQELSEASLHRYTPDLRPPEPRWQSS